MQKRAAANSSGVERTAQTWLGYRVCISNASAWKHCRYTLRLLKPVVIAAQRPYLWLLTDETGRKLALNRGWLSLGWMRSC